MRSLRALAVGPASPAQQQARARLRRPKDPVDFGLFLRRLYLLTAGSLVLRILFVILGRGNRLPTGDGQLFLGEARLLVKGELFVQPVFHEVYGVSQPTAMKPPLYVLYLGFWSLFGADSYLGARLVTTLIGAAVVLCAGLLVRRLAGHRAGLLAAALAAVNPSLWIADGTVMAESLYVLCLLGMLAAAYATWARPTARHALLLGAAMGLATLTRYEGLAYGGWLLVPLLVGMRWVPLTRRLYLFSLAAGALVLVLVPWAGFNLSRFEEPVLLGPPPGPGTLTANCDLVYSGGLLGYHNLLCLPPEFHDLDYERMRPRACTCAEGDFECVMQRCLRIPGDESVTYQRWYEQGMDYARANLDRVPLVVAARIGRVWNVYRPFQGVDLDTHSEGRGRLPSLLGLLMFWALLVPASFGLLELRRRRLPITPFLALMVASTIAVALTIGITRYRIPIDLAQVLLGGVGLDAAWRRWRPGPVVEQASIAGDRTEVGALAG